MSQDRPEMQTITGELDPEVIFELRREAHRTGVPAAEIMRNYLVTQGMDIPSMSLDGVYAVTPDFDAELVGLLNYEQAKAREERGEGDDQ